MKIIRLCLTIGLSCVFFWQSTLAQADLETAKQQFLNDPWLQNASVGILLMDLSNKQKLIAHNEQVAIPPASTVKLFSTATALEVMGPDYQAKTRLYTSANLREDGSLNGDLWIRGGGDISLGSRYYNDESNPDGFLRQWADTLYTLGLRKVNGNIVGDASEFGYMGAPDGWNWGDMGNYYGSGPSGLPIYDNMLRYYLRTGGKSGSLAELVRTFPEISGLRFKSYIEAANIRGDNSYIYGAPFSLERFGTGYLPRNTSSYLVKGSLPDPEFQFASELLRVLKLKGIEVNGEALGVRNMKLAPAHLRYKGLNLLYTHAGRSIRSITWWTNMKSVNIFAEQLAALSAYMNGLPGDTKTATDFMERFWRKRISVAGLNLKDGSGLSRSNAVSPSNFCELLEYMHSHSSYAKEFRESLPVAGESGTLSKVCYGQAAHGRIWAKSGTMNRIKAYAGYVKTVSGKDLAFALLVNNYTCTSDQVVERMEKLFNAMVMHP